ncbi:MAG TPA: sugar kinase [Balneola sp.]|nr:sugar kinase [Bacteroidota bacterium]MAC06210.1 sugar kinase [Balneola sp.]MAO77198.1 sugar kinase [Balneola sp.]MBF62991.1 sugar kinase [Balneola sp.]HAH52634.1 sugar kinase [Balneola sp.]
MSKGTLIGIDLGGTNVRVATVLDNKIETMISEPVSGADNAELLINQIKSMISTLWDANIEGIGIGVPSVVDVEKGIVYDVQNIPSWKEVPLKQILENEFGKPVFINNDANCFALGEKYFGEAKNYKSVVGLILGTGFGSGLILNNILYSGNNCGAGEVGMLPYKDSIFEHYCSGQFFEIHKKTSGQELFSKALKGDKEALEAYNEFGAHLGNAIKVVVYAYDPEIIVLGGSVSKAFSFFKESMFEALEDFAYPNSIRNLKITTTERESVAVLGAAALVLDHQILNK